MSDKILARFVSPVTTPDANKKTIKVAGKPFEYVDLDENTAKLVMEQASLYCLKDYYSHELEYDEDPYPSKYTGVKEFELASLTSISSSYYSTDAPQGDLVVIGGVFMGVILAVSSKGGNGWDNYNYSGYTFFGTDGTVLGNKKSEYSYSGETSSKYYEDEYSLVKK